MKRMVIIFREWKRYLKYPLLLLSPLAVLLYFANPVLNEVFPLLFSFVVPAYYVYYKLKNSRYAVAAGTAVCGGSIALYSLSEHYFSLIFVLLCTMAVTMLFRRFRLEGGYFLSLALVFALTVILYFSSPYFSSITKYTAAFLKNRGVLFGVFSNIDRLFFTGELDNVVLKSGYSGTELRDGTLVSGIANIFLLQPHHPSLAAYMSGRYFEVIFLTLGAVPLLTVRALPEERLPLILLGAYTLLCGDNRLLSLFLFIYHPLLYMVFLMGVFLSYFIPALLGISMGYVDSASLAELFKNGDKPVYFLISGAVLALLTVYLFRIVLLKFDFQQEEYYPKDVKKLLSALGGRDNIDGIDRGEVFVKNPNLIDILKLDCDIHQNVVTLYPEDLELIRKYV